MEHTIVLFTAVAYSVQVSRGFLSMLKWAHVLEVVNTTFVPILNVDTVHACKSRQQGKSRLDTDIAIGG